MAGVGDWGVRGGVGKGGGSAAGGDWVGSEVGELGRGCGRCSAVQQSKRVGGAQDGQWMGHQRRQYVC